MIPQFTTSSLLASFATLKGLSDEKKYQSPYHLLQEFIRYIVETEHLHSFSSAEMKRLLNNNFSFQIPEAVIKSASKKMNIVYLENGIFKVKNIETIKDTFFQETKEEADKYSQFLVDNLSNYIKTRTQKNTVDEVVLLKELICFLVEDQPEATNYYSEYISEYVLKNEKDETIQRGLNKIKEGSIIYIGLSHNINETGSISKPLKLYLGTEILFSLIGYNGVIYKQFADDFYEQVRLANSGKQETIQLYYFSETKKEISDFFLMAESIVEGKKHQWIEKPAMKAITDGCSTSSDVAVKESDFFTRLRTAFGIKEDPYDSYYDEESFSSNLEYMDIEEFEFEEDKKRKRESKLKMISHINKLRKGKIAHFDLDSEYLMVTNSQETLLVSKEQTDIIKDSCGNNVSGFAVSLDRITNLLWFKLGSGFSKGSYPKSASVLLKARAVLSSAVAQKAYKTFTETKEQYKNGNLDKETVAARIITLRGKTKLPEELKAENIEEIMDFSPEFLSRIEEQYITSQNSIKEKEKLIESIKKEHDFEILEKEATIKSQASIISDKEKETNALIDELNVYRRKEEKSQRKKQKAKNILLFAWSILWKIIIVTALCGILMFIEKRSDHIKPFKYIPLAIELIGIFISVISTVKKDGSKYFGKRKDNQDSK